MCVTDDSMVSRPIELVMEVPELVAAGSVVSANAMAAAHGQEGLSIGGHATPGRTPN